MIAAVLPRLALAVLLCAYAGSASAEPRVDALLARMSIEEKVGQLNLVSRVPEHETKFEPIARGLKDGSIGGLFNVHGAELAKRLQARARESRLAIPLLLALDVVHGYRTIFPTPLAQAASFDMAAIRESERIAAVEAAADGVNMVFTPMLDVTRDPRWGRAVEGPGESAWLAEKIAAARIEGLQGGGLRSSASVMACAKHLGANGAVEGGRDYTAQDLSERALREIYLPPFRAAVAAGARCMMAAFNAPDGVPSVANPRLITDILRAEWGFGGAVMSDFEAIEETLEHGYVADRSEAARLAFQAGTDVDMQSEAYLEALPGLVRSGAVKEAALDAAVRRVLTLKAELGLFDDPDRGAEAALAARRFADPAHRAAAQNLAEKSFVLLKNEEKTLPFPPKVRRVALIGPLGDSAADTLGPWAARGEPDETVTLKAGLEDRLGRPDAVEFTPGGTVFASRAEEIEAAVETARRADVVVLALGERFNQSGEAASRAALDLPGDQMRLARAVLALGKPAAIVVFAGRPLALTGLAEVAPAILYAWQPGTMGGGALARTLFGDVAPSGRLPMTFPRSVGQIPIHHDQRATGRPAATPPKPFTAGYADESHQPLYPFGFGLAYTSFSYSRPVIEPPGKAGEAARVAVTVTNTGERPGVAVPQLYLRATSARVAPALKRFRGFERVALQPGETRVVTFAIRPEDYGFWTADGRFEIPEGPIDVMTGPDAEDLQSATLRARS